MAETAGRALSIDEIELDGPRPSVAAVQHSDQRHAAGHLRRDVVVPTPDTTGSNSNSYDASASASSNAASKSASGSGEPIHQNAVRPEQTDMRPPPVPPRFKRSNSQSDPGSGPPSPCLPSPSRKRARFTPDRGSLKDFQAAAARRRVHGSDAEPNMSDRGRSDSTTFTELSARRRGGAGTPEDLPTFSMTGDAPIDDVFRAAVDDLTIENQKLRNHLRAHPTLPPEVQHDRLFELQCFRALSHKDRKRLEDTLAEFARSLEPPAPAPQTEPVQQPARGIPKPEHTTKSITAAHAAARLASQSITPSTGTSTSSTGETDAAADDTPPTTASEQPKRRDSPAKTTMSGDSDELAFNVPASSTIIFYRGGNFCSDMSADAVEKEHAVPVYEAVKPLDESDEEEILTPSDELDEGKALMFQPDEHVKPRHNVLFKASLAASGMTDAVIEDNFTVLVGQQGSGVAQLLMHVPEIQPRSHAYLRRSSRGVWLRVGAGDPDEAPAWDSSGPEAATPSVTASELRQVSPQIFDMHPGDYNISLREPTLPWAPSITTMSALAEANRALLNIQPISQARSASPSSGRSSGREGDLSSTPPEDEMPIDLDADG